MCDGSRVHEKNFWPQGHTDWVRSAVYSPDGKKILSASDDGIYKEWDAITGQCLKTHKREDYPDLSEYEFRQSPGPPKAELKTKFNKIIVSAAPGKDEEMVLIIIPGLWIQGCSFKNLEKGSQWTRRGLEMLKQYGAIL